MYVCACGSLVSVLESNEIIIITTVISHHHHHHQRERERGVRERENASQFPRCACGITYLRGQKIIEMRTLEDGIARRAEVWLAKLGESPRVVAGVDQCLVEI